MSLVHIVSRFSCDKCGSLFDVFIEEACVPPNGWCVMGVAESMLMAEMESTKGGLHFCSKCTNKLDREEEV